MQFIRRRMVIKHVNNNNIIETKKKNALKMDATVFDEHSF